jgi:hypothetical protein
MPEIGRVSVSGVSKAQSAFRVPSRQSKTADSWKGGRGQQDGYKQPGSRIATLMDRQNKEAELRRARRRDNTWSWADMFCPPSRLLAFATAVLARQQGSEQGSTRSEVAPWVSGITAPPFALCHEQPCLPTHDSHVQASPHDISASYVRLIRLANSIGVKERHAMRRGLGCIS